MPGSLDPQHAWLAAARTLGEALGLAGSWLREAGSETPALDAQALLAHVVGSARATLLAYPERALTPEQAATYADLVARRVAHEPVAYLTGRREFMGLEFHTDRRALIPRPETELLVEAALGEIRQRLSDLARPAPIAADIGTGSGAIAVALAALETRLARVYAVDISSDALALAAENTDALGVAARVIAMAGDLLEPLPEPVDIILANLPYIAPDDANVAPSVRGYEPQLALYSPERGLAHIRRLLEQTPGRLRPGGALYLEFGYDQRAAVEALARQAFPAATLRVGADYAGWDRYIEIHTAPGG
ncbi:MAG TPA: peptide chain release factor N(5)-glutamine methyltransferase [Ktedonobacterales bacterium]|nr:peptide chain release factor N(5)-glutamine methyltransferase [Ktedonobacterales bacterium]